MGDNPNKLVNSDSFDDLYKHGAVLYWNYAQEFNKPYVPCYGRELALNKYQERVRIPTSHLYFKNISFSLNKLNENPELENGLARCSGFSLPILSYLSKKVDSPEDLIGAALELRQSKNVIKLRDWSRIMDELYLKDYRKWWLELQKFESLTGRIVNDMNVTRVPKRIIQLSFFGVKTDIKIQDFDPKKYKSKTRLLKSWVDNFTKHPDFVDNTLKILGFDGLISPQIVNRLLYETRNGKSISELIEV